MTQGDSRRSQLKMDGGKNRENLEEKLLEPAEDFSKWWGFNLPAGWPQAQKQSYKQNKQKENLSPVENLWQDFENRNLPIFF